MLIKQLAFENANDDCRSALTPIYSKGDTTIQDMLRVCQNVGTHTYKAHLLAAAQVATNPVAGRKCFSCGKEGHFRAQCRSAPKGVARPSKKCPICHKGYHWANQCRSHSDNLGQTDNIQGNQKAGQPQARPKN